MLSCVKLSERSSDHHRQIFTSFSACQATNTRKKAMQGNPIATRNNKNSNKNTISTMGIMNERSARVAQIHGMLWPRYLFQEESPSSKSSILQRRGSGGNVNKKALPNKVRKNIPSFQRRRDEERIVRSLSEQLKDIGNRNNSCSSPLPSATLSPVDVKVISPSFSKNLTTLIPTLGNHNSIPSLVPEHSYYWGRAGQYGKPALIDTTSKSKKWSRITPVKSTSTTEKLHQRQRQGSIDIQRRRRPIETTLGTSSE